MFLNFKNGSLVEYCPKTPSQRLGLYWRKKIGKRGKVVFNQVYFKVLFDGETTPITSNPLNFKLISNSSGHRLTNIFK